MKRYKCVGACVDFTVGKVYFTNKNGELIDDDGDERLAPKHYLNRNGYKFVECPISLENK